MRVGGGALVRFPNPARGGRNNTCKACGDPCGFVTYCCSTCAETAYYAKTCGRDCDCESLAAHDAAQDEAEKDFLRDPGPPPADWSEDRVERARAGIREAQRSAGIA